MTSTVLDDTDATEQAAPKPKTFHIKLPNGRTEKVKRTVADEYEDVKRAVVAAWYADHPESLEAKALANGAPAEREPEPAGDPEPAAEPFQIMPELDAATEAAMRASILRFGVLVPVTRDQHGR